MTYIIMTYIIMTYIITYILYNDGPYNYGVWPTVCLASQDPVDQLLAVDPVQPVEDAKR